jgi:hypothetical protein
LTLTVAITAASAFVLVVAPSIAFAQQVQITPNPEITPTDATTPWVIYMAIAAAFLGFLLLVALISGYMKFGPKFFGKESVAKPLPLGARPPELVRQAAAIRPPAPPSHPAPAVAAAPAAPATAVAVAERPPAPAAVQAPAPAPATVEAPAAEAPPTAPPPTAPPPAAAATPPPSAAAEAPAVAGPPTATATPASPGSEMDQETFDRVLQEQLDKGVDRRVAEGRARAAAVVAGRKKARG